MRQLQLRLARGYELLGEWVKARDTGLEVIQEIERDGGDRRTLAAAQSRTGFVQEELAQYMEAEKNLRSALANAIATLGEHHLQVAGIRLQRVELFTNLGRYDEAQQELNEATGIIKDWGPQGKMMMGTALQQAAVLLIDQNQAAQGLAALQAALPDFGVGHAGSAQVGIAKAYARLGRIPEAIDVVRPALSVVENEFGPGDPWIREIRVELAGLLRLNRQHDQAWAIVYGDPALNFDDLPVQHPFHALLLRERGLLEAEAHHPAQARAQLTESLAIYQSLFGRDAERTREVEQDLKQLPL